MNKSNLKKSKKITKSKSTHKPTRRSKKKSITHAGRRDLWKGSIAFGLVNIPVTLASAQEEEKIHFRLIDKADHSPIGYKQINKSTGKEVTRASIVKGYEYKKGQYVLMSDADFKKANVKATRSIEIQDFVELSEIDPMLFEKPYYVLPQAGGEKGYVLLREVLKRTKKAAVATIVIHTIQHLVAIQARADYLVLEILRYANEIVQIHEAHLLDAKVSGLHVSPREMTVAEQLVESMSSAWTPEKYHNTYREDLMKLVKAKIKKGATAEVEEIEPEADDETPSNVLDLTALLKKSLSKKGSRAAHGA